MTAGVFFLVGATGTGKTDVALHVARKVSLEIISADAFQIYRGMDIGTAKPGNRERKLTPHHLIDVCGPATAYSIFRYYKEAMKVIRNVAARGKVPLVVGGTGLYVKVLLDGLTQHPAPPADFRKKLEALYRKKGVAALAAELSKLDPERLGEIDSRNPRRLIRAIEMAWLRRKYPGRLFRLPALSDEGFTVRVFGLTMDREKLYERVNRRVDEMFEKGWLREIARLGRKRIGVTARQAIGYRLLFSRPEASDEVRALIKTDTRHLIKKQLTWFKKDPRIVWLNVTTPRLRKKAETAICTSICDYLKEQRSCA